MLCIIIIKRIIPKKTKNKKNKKRIKTKKNKIE